MPKISVGDSFTVALISGEQGGYQNFTSKNFCLTVPTKISAGESFIVAINSGIEKSLEERGRGRYQDFPSTIFCLTVPTKNSVGESFIVVLISGIEKVWSRGGGGEGWGYQVFPLKIFCLTVPKISIGESFSVALIFGEEGGVSKVYVEMFLSHNADEIFRSRILYCCINFGYRKSLEERGGVSRFSVENFCLKVPTKISVGECFIVALISVTEKVWRRGGSIKNFRQNFFVSQCRKFP